MSFRTDALGLKCLFAPYFIFSLLLLSGSRRQSCHPFVLTAATCNTSPTVAAVVAFRLRRPKTEELFPRRNRKKETKGGNHLCWLPPSSPLKAHLSFWHETRKLRFTVQNLLKKHQQDGLFICAFSFFGTELVVLKGSRLVFKMLQILDGLSEERQSERGAYEQASAAIYWLSVPCCEGMYESASNFYYTLVFVTKLTKTIKIQ